MSLIEGQGRMQDRADRWLRQVEPRQLRALVVVAVLVAAAWLGPRASRTMLLAIVALLALGLALRRPRLQLPMLLLAAAFVPLEIGTGTDSSINIALIGVAGLTGLGLIQAMLGGDLRLRPAPANLPWLVLILVAGLSVVAGAALWSPWVVTKNSFILVQGAQWSIFALSACAYWLGAHRVSDRDQLGRLVVLLLALGAGFLVVNFMPGVYRFGGRILLGGPVFRICVVALASSLALFRPELDRRLRLGLGLLAVLVIGLAYLRGSDWASGWLPALFGLLLVGVLWAWERMQWRVLPYALFAAILGAFFVLPWLARGDVYSLDTRMIAWNGIVQLLEGRWLLGLGLASYWHYWRGVLGSISYWDPKIGYLHYTFDPTVNLHNNYLDMVAQMGFLGLAALLWLLAALTLHIWRRYQAEPPGFGKAYAAAALATLGAMAASGMLGDWFFPFVYNIGLHGFRDSFVGWMLLGGVVALDATAADPAASMPGVREPSPAEREPSPADGAAAANRVEAGSA